MEKKEFKEECWLIKGFKIKDLYVGGLVYQGAGSFSSVDFDWRKVEDKSVLGFYHTHPRGYTTPSDRDDRTMGAMVRSEGRPLICGILTESSNKCYMYSRKNDKTIGCVLFKQVKILGNKILIGVLDGTNSA